MPYFQLFTFQTDGANLLQLVVPLWNPEALASYIFIYSGTMSEDDGTRSHPRAPAGSCTHRYAARRQAERGAEPSRSDGGTAFALAGPSPGRRGRGHSRDSRIPR